MKKSGQGFSQTARFLNSKNEELTLRKSGGPQRHTEVSVNSVLLCEPLCNQKVNINR